jgi:hypothetical protein
MEVAMIRSFLRHTLLALAALALVSAFASSPASAQSSDNPRKYGVFMDTKHGKAKTPKGLATQKPGKNPVGLRDQEFRTNERLMTVR